MPGWDEFDGNESSMERLLNEWAFPFNDFDAANSPATSFVPTWAQRLNAAVFGDEFNRWNASNVKPAMGWLVNNGSYDVQSVQGQQDLARDTGILTRVMTGITAIAGALGPTTPNYQRVVRDGDDQQYGLVQISNLFYREYLPQNDGDYNKATAAFLDAYGPEFLATIAGASEGGFRTSDEAWRKADQYPEAWQADAESFSRLFPGSRSSIAAARWVQMSGQKRYKSNEDRADGITRLLYEAELGRIEKRAVDEGWDDDKMKLAKRQLFEEFGPVADSVQGGFGADAEARIMAMKGFVDSRPEMADEPSVKAFQAAYSVREKVTARAKALGIGGLSGGLGSQAAAQLRGEYAMWLNRIEESLPGSSLVIDMFANEWDDDE